MKLFIIFLITISSTFFYAHGKELEDNKENAVNMERRKQCCVDHFFEQNKKNITASLSLASVRIENKKFVKDYEPGVGLKVGFNVNLGKNYNYILGSNLHYINAEKEISSIYLGARFGLKKYFNILNHQLYASGTLNPAINLHSSPDDNFEKLNVFAQVNLGLQTQIYKDLFFAVGYTYGLIDISKNKNIDLFFNGFLFTTGTYLD